MRKAVWLGGVVSTIGLIFIVERASSLPQSTPVQAAPAAFKPVSELEHLMEGQEMHFKAIGELLKDSGAKNRHKHIAMHADVLAELANVNTFNRDKEDYKTWAGQVRDLSLKLAAAAGKGASASDDELKGIGKQISDTCAACHDAYD